VTVSSLGDAKTLQGGVLIQTPLLGADGQVMPWRRGLVIGGFSPGLMVPAAPPCRRIIQPWARSSAARWWKRKSRPRIVNDNHLETAVAGSLLHLRGAPLRGRQ